MSNIILNQLNTTNWNYQLIDQKFDVFQITLGKHADRNILNVQDERLKIVSTVYLSGQSVFFMTLKNSCTEDVIQYVLSNNEKGCTIYVRRIMLKTLSKRSEEMRKLFGYRNRALVQLLINSTLNMPIFPEDEYNNITGRCYYFNTDWNEDISKRIELIDFTIGKDMSLYPSVVTFTKERPNMDFPERIIYDRKRNVIRKPVGKEDASVIYYRHGQEFSHSSRAFDGTTLSYWEKSRMACLARFFLAIQQELHDYVTLEFTRADGKEITVKNLEQGIDNIASILREDGLCIVDNVILSTKEEQPQNKKMEKFREWIEESRQSVLCAVKNYCQTNKIKVRDGQKDLHTPNIVLLRPELFYKCNKQVQDPYTSDDGIICQHITIPCATKGKSFYEEIGVLFKELAIKADIREKHIRITDWSQYNCKHTISFCTATPQERKNNRRPILYKLMKILVDGTFTIEKFIVDADDLFSADNHYHRQIAELFYNNSYGYNYFDRNIELVVVPNNEIADAVKIRRTNIRAMSDYKAMKEAFESEKMNSILDVSVILSAIEPFQWDSSPSAREVYYNIVEELSGQDSILKSQLMPLLYPSLKDGQKKPMICRRVKETIENATGVVLRVSRSDETEEQLGISIYRHIHLWKSTAYDCNNSDEKPFMVYNYTVGQYDKPNQSISTSPVVRQIYRTDYELPDDELIASLIKMMQVGFVRMKNYTVLPFPAKYLREF